MTLMRSLKDGQRHETMGLCMLNDISIFILSRLYSGWFDSNVLSLLHIVILTQRIKARSLYNINN